MNVKAALCLGLLLLGSSLQADEPVPKTLMTTCGKQLVSEDFAKAPPPYQGKPKGFASGYQGWFYTMGKRAGDWSVTDGSLKGVENPEVMHPATASVGFDFKDAVIACEVQMDDVPLNGRRGRNISIRATDDKDYVCTIGLYPGGFHIQKDDNDHEGPDVNEKLGSAKAPNKVGEWIPVVFEILGDEMVGTVNGVSLTGRHPNIDRPKHSVMFVIGNEGRIRNVRAWEALPNPEWEQNKAKLPAPLAPKSEKP
ncbi:LamG domain-containing protein [Planctomicrobium piriforme]|uniref:3-keto-disaccharide hydrolase domain-containing protein n=1 Tax=Planctomicrobium piriforme TaxID=1576369 RepID=A0A1I3K068_9PLAN|nr:hypothetical protein [Planctomicrobium piriforme]SFI65826.1 hypothetical protein SAMN05421753_11174 [Planctomicrobium piriforme]